MSVVLAFLVLVMGLLVLDAAALLWGVDTRDGPESPEWERRRTWGEYRN